MTTVVALALAAVLLAGADDEGDGAASRKSPYALVLGTAQDGGLPQVGCRGACCETARQDASRRRLVASFLIVDPRSSRRWLIDATPDLREQVERARDHAPPPADAPRPPLFDGVLLTHAHMGHYTGLYHLGNEAYGARELPLYAGPRMSRFLWENEPWRRALEEERFRLVELVADEAIELSPGLSIAPLLVPHRDEFSETFAFRVQGPRRTLLYLPDIDQWDRWDRRIEDEIARADVALLDGTFFADGELPGRAIKDIPHPFIEETIGRFAALPDAERRKVRFVHLNHTNPVADPESPAAAAVAEAGMAVAADGEIHEL